MCPACLNCTERSLASLLAVTSLSSSAACGEQLQACPSTACHQWRCVEQLAVAHMHMAVAASTSLLTQVPTSVLRSSSSWRML